MPEFMVMILANEDAEGRVTPSETKALVEGHSAYERRLRAVSAYVDGERLRPSIEGRRVSLRDGQPHVEPGPFGDTPLAGYYIIDAENLNAAVALAEQCPLSSGAALDVRPIMKSHTNADKGSQQGRVFAFAVLGNAPTEAGWVEIMDRIDVSTRDNFPADRTLGGVRLHAPGLGRRVTAVGGHRAVFDGPFLESKEVIGGLVFLRMASLDEAVEWAGRSEFVKHGVLEIRELWRS